MSDIFETLREEHEKARTLMDLVAKTHGDSDGRREMFAKLKKELDEHATAEENSFYKPLFGTHAQDKATHAIKEHEEVRECLEALEKMDYSSSAWLPKFSTLRDMVEHHMDEEEHMIFQQAGRVLSDTQKESLAGTHRRLRQ